MTKQVTRLGRSRYLALTVGAGVIGLITAILVAGAPPVPSTLGVTIAVAWLLWRAPARDGHKRKSRGSLDEED